MGLTFKIAWRNIWRHKGKSLVIGVILFIGALLMTVGNGMISGMENGLSENIVNLFTGDILIISDEQEKDNILLDLMTAKPLKVIKNYEAAREVLESEEMIADYLPAASGLVFLLNPRSEMGSVYLLGVDIDRYQRMFPNSIKITEGRIFERGERGVLISEFARKPLYDFMEYWLLPQDGILDESKLPEEAKEDLANLDVRSDIVFMGASDSNSTIDIRVPVTGIIEYKALNKIWGYYCLVDIESFREAHNYVTGADRAAELSPEEEDLLATEDLEDLFSSGDLFTDVITDESITLDQLREETARELVDYDLDDGSYNLAFIKLKAGVSTQEALAKLNRVFREKGIKVRAISWKEAVGAIGSMAVMVKAALNLFIMFIFFVAMIIIMNTLSMAALERTSELAMMRAIGARKGFLRRMFLAETSLLSFFFGGLGIASGIIVIYLIRAADISTTNEILQLLYGGEKLSPLYTSADFLLGLVELGIVTFLSVIYPLRVVGKIVPLDAIVRE
ncbi:MAG TPA: FtsX-like permease family protein [Firmicutes bacterium]|nr:FtsX-like permease family protein [Bacillota bacterium]